MRMFQAILIQVNTELSLILVSNIKVLTNRSIKFRDILSTISKSGIKSSQMMEMIYSLTMLQVQAIGSLGTLLIKMMSLVLMMKLGGENSKCTHHRPMKDLSKQIGVIWVMLYLFILLLREKTQNSVSHHRFKITLMKNAGNVLITPLLVSLLRSNFANAQIAKIDPFLLRKDFVNCVKIILILMLTLKKHHAFPILAILDQFLVLKALAQNA
jgi:hypothetical protein